MCLNLSARAESARPLAALIVANSSLEQYYTTLLCTTGEVRIGPVGLAKSLEHGINDGLMAIFLLLVGLEIKREVCEGELASLRQATLPVVAALGVVLRLAAKR